MTERELNTAFSSMTPSDSQKARVLDAVLAGEKPLVHQTKPKRNIRVPRKTCFATAVACLVLSLTLLFSLPFGGATTALALSVRTPNGENVLIEDPDMPADSGMNLSTSVSFVDNGPSLRFFIGNKDMDIAQIEITSENEYVSALDWTKTLDRKYWDPELFYEQTVINGTSYQYVPTKNLYEKSLVISFPEGFTDYDKVWYDWYGLNLREWASQDNFAHIQSYYNMEAEELQKLYENATEDEKMAIASGGGDTSAAGHILLEGYPEEKLRDRVSIIITDRQGNTITKTLSIQISNNSLGQNVVTAELVD